MKNKKKIICEEFEKEVFLFQEGSLPKERIELIEYHLGICQYCQTVFKDLTEQEKNLLQDQGFLFCALTPTILRAQQAVALSAGLIRSLLR